MPFEPQRFGGKLSPLVMPRYSRREYEVDPEFDAATAWFRKHARQQVRRSGGVEFYINEVCVAFAYISGGVHYLELYADKT